MLVCRTAFAAVAAGNELPGRIGEDSRGLEAGRPERMKIVHRAAREGAAGMGGAALFPLVMAQYSDARRAALCVLSPPGKPSLDSPIWERTALPSRNDWQHDLPGESLSSPIRNS